MKWLAWVEGGAASGTQASQLQIMCCNHPHKWGSQALLPSLQCPSWMMASPLTLTHQEVIKTVAKALALSISLSSRDGSQNTGSLIMIKYNDLTAARLPEFEGRYRTALYIPCSSLNTCYWSLSGLWPSKAFLLTHWKQFLQSYARLLPFLHVSLHFCVFPDRSIWLSRQHFFCIYVAIYPSSQQWINHYVYSLSWERYWLIDSSPGGQELVCYLIRLNFIWGCPRCHGWFNELTSWTMKVGAWLCASAQETQFVYLIGPILCAAIQHAADHSSAGKCLQQRTIRNSQGLRETELTSPPQPFLFSVPYLSHHMFLKIRNFNWVKPFSPFSTDHFPLRVYSLKGLPVQSYKLSTDSGYLVS